MNERTARQISEMKNQTIGVEVEMNSITRQTAAKLAAEYSADTQVNKSHGGLIEWTSPNMFEKDFAEGFKSLKVGSIAPKPIKTALGWHIVKLEGSRKAQRYADFDTEAPELRQRLVAVKVQSYIEELIKTAKIKDLK